MRRIAILAALLAACAPKPIRPAPDVELVQATPIGAGHGLLLPRLRLTADRLLFGGPTREWRQLSRDSGTVTPLPTLDAQSTVCTAAGRQWAHRDEHLLTMDNGDLRSTVATFIPPAMRHQWTLVEDAWRSVTTEPRDHIWTLRTPTTAARQLPTIPNKLAERLIQSCVSVSRPHVVQT